MKLLKIEDSCGHYLKSTGEYFPVDKMDKSDLLALIDWTLHQDSVEFDEHDDALIRHQAHQVIYKSILRKLKELRERRQEFIDESKRLFIEDYEKYRGSTAASPETGSGSPAGADADQARLVR